MIVGILVLSITGILFLVIGYLLWAKEKANLLHSYHTDKVSEENKKSFCKLSGLGMVLSGVGLLLSAIFLAITNSILSFIPFGIGFLAGITLLICAGKIYNH